jgi:hypothetical protein
MRGMRIAVGMLETICAVEDKDGGTHVLVHQTRLSNTRVSKDDDLCFILALFIPFFPLFLSLAPVRASYLALASPRSRRTLSIGFFLDAIFCVVS